MKSTRRVWLWLFAAAVAGCAGPNPAITTGLSPKASGTAEIDPQRVQANTMSFADGYVAGMADAYDRVQSRSTSSDAKLAAVQGKGLAAIGAMGNAVNPNPVAGLMDMALMVTLTRRSIEEPWARQVFGQDNVDILLMALKPREMEIWQTASSYLTAEQIAELRKLAERWHSEHPDQRFWSSGRLADFAEAKQPSRGAGSLVGGVFNLIRLDPFSNLDPAVREVEKSRLLGERLFFYLQHMPLLLSWQLDATYLQMLEAPQVTQLVNNTTAITGNTTRFTDATTRFTDQSTRFTDASSRFAGTIEDFRRQLPAQQATLVQQLDDLVARQRDAILKQATTQVAALRDDTVQQLTSSVGSQQNEAARNLQGITDQSIERLYARARALILIATGSILAAVLVYRIISATIFGVRGRHAEARRTSDGASVTGRT